MVRTLMAHSRLCNFPAEAICNCGTSKGDGDVLSKSESNEIFVEQRRSTMEQMRRDTANKAKQNNDPHFTVEEIAEALGQDAKEFLDCMAIVEAIIADPASYTGAKAGITATKLAGLRTKIGAVAQMYKSASVGNPELRKRKDVLMTMYDALIENINTLKSMTRYERDIV